MLCEARCVSARLPSPSRKSDNICVYSKKTGLDLGITRPGPGELDRNPLDDAKLALAQQMARFQARLRGLRLGRPVTVLQCLISFDFSAHATCPNDRPNSLAQTLTECKAPRPLVRSWLRRAVLPSTARMGWSTPVAAVASARNDCSQLAKQAWKAAGFKAIRTRRKTSLLGIPLGKSRTCKRNSCFRTAHCAIAIGPPAPASTASKAMTTTLSKGCRRLISERGSSSSSKCRMISSIPIRCASAMVHPPGALLLEKPHRGRYTRKQPRAQALQITKITYKCALALGYRGVRGG